MITPGYNLEVTQKEIAEKVSTEATQLSILTNLTPLINNTQTAAAILEFINNDTTSIEAVVQTLAKEETLQTIKGSVNNIDVNTFDILAGLEENIPLLATEITANDILTEVKTLSSTCSTIQFTNTSVSDLIIAVNTYLNTSIKKYVNIQYFVDSSLTPTHRCFLTEK